MMDRFPEDPVDGFPAPPRTFTDSEGREIELREVDPGAVEALVEMYLAFDPEDRAQGIPPVSEDAIREWLDVVTGPEAFGVVASHGDSAVGHVMLVSDERGAYELAIFVLQDYQGAHIGTELIRTALGLAEREGVERIWLSVERWNSPAISLYRKVGFERVGDESFELEMALQLDTD